MVILSS